jgi:Leucine-rich repeat (LRR) protein
MLTTVHLEGNHLTTLAPLSLLPLLTTLHLEGNQVAGLDEVPSKP